MPKTNQNGIFCSCTGKNWLWKPAMIEKSCWEPSTRTKYFFFHQLSVELGGWQ